MSAVTLGDLAGRLDRLEVRCRRCQRHGLLRLARLIADHGAGTGLPDLAVRLAAGCPKAETPDWGERCFVHYPQLLEPGDAEAGQERDPASPSARMGPAR